MSISKIVVSGVVAVSLFGATAASAQTYYPSYTPSYTSSYSSGSCGNVTTTLSYGSTGTQVSALQNFLVAQNYPGGGSWMVTGFYGTATAAAVRDFQQAHGLPQTGSVDSSTLAAINSCGGTSYLPGLGGTGYTTPYTYTQTNPYTYTNPYITTPYTYTYPTNYNNNYNYNYNTGCGVYPYYTTCTNPYGSAPTLTSLSVTSALPGMQITAYGTSFDPVSNTVYVGGVTLSGIPSYDGVSLVFTVPANASNVVSVSVGNSHGTSNALTLSVSGTVTCGVYPYTNCGTPTYPIYPTSPCGYGYPYTSNCINTGIPTISYITPTSGGVGTSVTVLGSGFSTTGNAVHFGNGIIGNLLSSDGRSLSFTVPTTISGYGYQPVGLGTYNVSVSNSAGVSSNSMPFTITSLGGTGAPTITGVTGPTSLAVGAIGTWSLNIQNPTGSYVTTSVTWGDTGNGYVNQAAPQTTYAQGASTLTFTHAYIAAGTYTVTFTVSNENGQQNTTTETVYVSGTGSNGAPSVSYITPSSGYPGQLVTIYGSNFAATNNTLNFGVGTIPNISSNGSSLTFNVPSFVSIYCAPGLTCGQVPVPVDPGTYNVSVTDQYGTSQTLSFQVQ